LLSLQVTLQSFLWSTRVAEKGTKAEVEALIQQCQSQLQEAPGVAGLADLAGTTPADVASVMVRATSGAGGTVDASVKRVIIGKVRLPDVCGETFVEIVMCHCRNMLPPGSPAQNHWPGQQRKSQAWSQYASDNKAVAGVCTLALLLSWPCTVAAPSRVLRMLSITD
jgi:hypothetical protein